MALGYVHDLYDTCHFYQSLNARDISALLALPCRGAQSGTSKRTMYVSSPLLLNVLVEGKNTWSCIKYLLVSSWTATWQGDIKYNEQFRAWFDGAKPHYTIFLWSFYVFGRVLINVDTVEIQNVDHRVRDIQFFLHFCTLIQVRYVVT